MSTSGDLKVVKRALEALIKLGFVEVVWRAGGEIGYRITDAGAKHLEAVIDGKKEE